MKRILFFITLVAVSGCVCIEEPPVKPKNCFKMQFSDALPVQFYLNGEETYNESVSHDGMIEEYCFIQEFECDDEIKLQFLENSGEYALRITDENDELIDDIDFQWTEEVTENQFPALSSFVNAGGGIAWTLGVAPTVHLSSGETARNLDGNASLLPGVYRIKYTASMSSGIENASNSINPAIPKALWFSNSDGLVTSVAIRNMTDEEITFELADEVDNVSFRFKSLGGSGDVVLSSVEIFGITRVYYASLMPSSEGICNEKIRLSIINQNIFFMLELSAWTNEGLSGLPWNLGATPSFDVPEGNGSSNDSDALSADIEATLNGQYSFNYSFSISGGGPGVNELSFQVILRSNGNQVGFASVPLGSGNPLSGAISVTATEPPDEIRLSFSYGSFDTPAYTITLDSFVNTQSGTGSTSTFARTDLINIGLEIAENVRVEYKGSKNYAGLRWNSESDPFMIRIPGVFFKQQSKGQTTSMELSNSKFITTSSVIQRKKKFSIQDCPDEFHFKYELIFNHATIGQVIINNVGWKRDSGDAYTKLEDDRPDTYPMAAAEILLTRANWVKRNAM